MRSATTKQWAALIVYTCLWPMPFAFTLAPYTEALNAAFGKNGYWAQLVVQILTSIAYLTVGVGLGYLSEPKRCGRRAMPLLAMESCIHCAVDPTHEHVQLLAELLTACWSARR